MTQTRDIFNRTPIKRRFKRESRKLSFVAYQAFYGPIVFIRAIYRQLLLLLVMIVCGAGVFSYFDQLPFIGALLAAVSTITTLGFYAPNNGNLFTIHPVQAVLLIIMIVISVGAGASIVQSSINAITRGDLAKGQVGKKFIKKLKGHVIVLGYTHLGKYVTDKLDSVGLDYVVVTKNPIKYDELLKRNCFAVLESENQPMDALTTAGIEHAAMIVVAHEKDPDNMLSILSARKMRHDIRIVSVVHNPSLTETAKNAGADMVIPSSVTVGHLLALSAVTKNIVGVVFSERIGAQEIAEFAVFKASKLIGKGLQEISSYATPIGVLREGKVVRNLFDPTLRIQEDDTLLVFGDPGCMQALEQEAKAL
ncbi:MAG: NAD-binding protein [Candidatus Bathyarchaeota archaeon]|nr:NAD-binding protein [Candidatus Bathyarchaeota archaeon]